MNFIGSPCTLTGRQKRVTGECAKSGMVLLVHATPSFLLLWQRDQSRNLGGRRVLISGTFHTFRTGTREVQRCQHRGGGRELLVK